MSCKRRQCARKPAVGDSAVAYTYMRVWRYLSWGTVVGWAVRMRSQWRLFVMGRICVAAATPRAIEAAALRLR